MKETKMNLFYRRVVEYCRFRRGWKIAAVVLSVVVFVGTIGALTLPGITLTDTFACGYEEHVHTEDCYEYYENSEDTGTEAEDSEGKKDTKPGQSLADLVNGYFQSGAYWDWRDWFGESPDDTEEESDERVGEPEDRALICRKEEHIHSEACKSDKKSDVETAEDWEATLPALTGDWSADLVAVAESQVGYSESYTNFVLEKEEGSTSGYMVHKGYTRYGQWYHDKFDEDTLYSDWNGMFLSFCFHYAGVKERYLPQYVSLLELYDIMNNADYLRVVDEDEEFVPAPGDVVFLDTDGDGGPDTVGILTAVEENLEVIAGDVSTWEDVPGTVAVLRNPEGIVAYGDVSAAFASYEGRLDGGPVASGDAHPVTLYADSGYSVYRGDRNGFAIEVYGENIPAGMNFIGYPYSVIMDDVTVLASFHLEPDLGQVEPLSVNDEIPEPSELGPYTIRFVNVLEGVQDGEEIAGYTTDENGNLYPNAAVYGMDEEGVFTSLSAKAEGKDILFTVEEPSAHFAYVAADIRALYSIAEAGSPEAVKSLVDSGYFLVNGVMPFDENGNILIDLNNLSVADEAAMETPSLLTQTEGTTEAHTAEADGASKVQIVETGSSVSDAHGDDITVSKVISGTDVENVFNITLGVDTYTNIQEIYRKPDMAVVIVLDISNTMNGEYGDSTRYKAALAAGNSFIEKFASETSSVSKIGYVAFNTNATEILPLSECTTAAQASAMQTTIKTKTGSIISAAGYGDSHTRFTNIEAGLKMANDLLNETNIENKYIILLSDGFPTTYVKSGYSGYDPYTSSGTKGTDGVFYDYIGGTHCDYGTSYSDKGAIRAREQAVNIKATGTKIFTIGVDIGGQTIQKYDTHRGGSFSVIDRTSETYEIGSATDTQAFKNWLKGDKTTGIGSGTETVTISGEKVTIDYYMDSNNPDALMDAFNKIFFNLKLLHQAITVEEWCVVDPMPILEDETVEGKRNIEFLGFFDVNGAYRPYPGTSDLIGETEEGGENSATFRPGTDGLPDEINWDLKNSGYTTTMDGTKVKYHYKMVYRVRLENESADFTEGTVYPTNNPTDLNYRLIKTTDDNTSDYTEIRKISFPIPSVKGYLGELKLYKKTEFDTPETPDPIDDVEFTLTHDPATCGACRGDWENSVDIPAMVAVTGREGEHGVAVFTGIPSGHDYLLTETKTPGMYYNQGISYRVTVAYDVVTIVDLNDSTGESRWTIGTGEGQIEQLEIVNYIRVELPSTGGPGTAGFVIAGLSAMTTAVLLYQIKRKKRESAGDVE